MNLIHMNMNCVWAFLLLLGTPGGVLAQVHLQESGPALVKPSQTLSLTCVISGFSLKNWHTHWIRKAPGKALEWIGLIWNTGDTRYNSAFQSRVSITRDTSKEETYLKLDSVNPQDTAMYYCARDTSGIFEHWGQGIMVTVSSEPKATPHVFPLSLSSATQDGTVIVGCLIQGFFPPAPVHVTWIHNGDNVTFKDFPAVKASSRELYTMSSQLTLPAAQCLDTSAIQCRVQHYNSPDQVVRVPCKVPRPNCCCQPHLSLTRPPLKDLLFTSDANLTCTLSGLSNPKGATFTWKPSNGKDAVQKSPEQDSCGCYKVSSILPGCADPWKSGQIFTCSATHPEVRNLPPISISKGLVIPPLVYVYPPKDEELAMNEMVTLTCVIRGFSPKEVLVRWLREDQELPSSDFLTWEPLREPEPWNPLRRTPTYAVVSLLRISLEDWTSGDNFSCIVGHESLSLSFNQKSINKLAGKPTNVNVSVIMSEGDGVCY